MELNRNRYHVIVMYPATKQYADQTYDVIIDAYNVYIGDGVYRFVDSMNTLIACYPSTYSIIEKITKIKSND